jgi:hypothetical protein
MVAVNAVADATNVPAPFVTAPPGLHLNAANSILSLSDDHASMAGQRCHTECIAIVTLLSTAVVCWCMIATLSSMCLQHTVCICETDLLLFFF